MRKFLAALIVAFAFLTVGGTVAFATSGNHSQSHQEEADGCDHGATGKPCRDDPQPTNGKDCEVHGNHGGVNEDHCDGETSGTTTTTSNPPTSPSDTTTTQTQEPPSTTTSASQSPTSTATHVPPTTTISSPNPSTTTGSKTRPTHNSPTSTNTTIGKTVKSDHKVKDSLQTASQNEEQAQSTLAYTGSNTTWLILVAVAFIAMAICIYIYLLISETRIIRK